MTIYQMQVFFIHRGHRVNIIMRYRTANRSEPGLTCHFYAKFDSHLRVIDTNIDIRVVMATVAPKSVNKFLFIFLK